MGQCPGERISSAEGFQLATVVEFESYARRYLRPDSGSLVVITCRTSDLVETERSEVMAREIFASVCQQVRNADALVANLTPWRGPNDRPRGNLGATDSELQ